MSACSQIRFGLRPRPDHVIAGFSVCRYFATTGAEVNFASVPTSSAREWPRSRAKASTLARASTLCRSSNVAVALATSFCIFFGSLSDRTSRSKAAVDAVRVLDFPVSISHRGGALHFLAGKGSATRAGDSHFGRWGGAGLWVKQSDWQGVIVWHGLPVSLCLLGHPFD